MNKMEMFSVKSEVIYISDDEDFEILNNGSYRYIYLYI